MLQPCDRLWAQFARLAEHKTAREIAGIIKSPEMEAKLTAMGADVIGDSPEDFVRFLREDTTKWSKVAQQAGVKPE